MWNICAGVVGVQTWMLLSAHSCRKRSSRAELAAELKRFGNAKEISWCQEEPMNQGAWYQIQHHLRVCLQPGQVLDYTGRARSAAPACGHLATHVVEQAALLADALVNPADGDHVLE